MSTDPKVVEEGDVDFGESTARADEVQPPSNPTGPIVQGSSDDHALMMYLRDKVIDYLSEPAGGTHYLKPVADMLPYIVTLETYTNDSRFDQAKVGPLDTQMVRQALEQSYGPEISQAGIYEAIGMTEATIDPEKLFEFFPEFQAVSRLSSTVFERKTNPYLVILRTDVRHRPFLVGATRTIEGRCTDWDQLSDKLTKPLTLRDILEYAKTVNQVPRVADYARLYDSIKL